LRVHCGATNVEEDSTMDRAQFPIEQMYLIAVAIEQGGFDFYCRLMETCANPRVKNELRFLREEESRHKAFLLGELKKKGLSEATIGAAASAVLQAEFIKPLEEFYAEKKVGDTVAALRFGAAVEQKSIDFYVEFRTQTADTALLVDLDGIIEEERKHMQKLNIILTY
jgi:rubrerythrin